MQTIVQTNMQNLALYHIAYNDKTVAELPADFILMDNTKHERDDWREYWPIRQFLLNTSLDEERYYGFFSPRFAEKTGLDYKKVADFIQSAQLDANVFTFSPQADMGAFFLNIFEQEELFQPGFIKVSEDFFTSIDMPLRLASLIMDSRQIVFSNYIVAKPIFWRAWLALNEKLFALCEGPSTPLQQELTNLTSYPGAVPRKVFLMERIASLLLATDTRWKVRAYNTFACAWSASRLNQFKLEAVLSDALKIAMREQGYPEYTDAFAKLRDKLR